MNYIFELQQQEIITLPEALNAVQQLVDRYLPVLQNVMQIRNRAPVGEDEPAFRGATTHQEAVPQLCIVLSKLSEHINALAQLLQSSSGAAEAAPEKIIEKLLFLLKAALKKCQEIYNGRVTSFAMVLHDLSMLIQIFQEKLPRLDATLNPTGNLDDASMMGVSKDHSEIEVKTDEKLVYIRLFHRDMAALASGKGSLAWVKPLLDSAKQAEKHGFAVYEHEDDVRRSLKGQTYGFLTVKIRQDQDISHERPTKVDPAIGCRLLTISNIDLSNMMKLTHMSVEYWIRDGMLYKIQGS